MRVHIQPDQVIEAFEGVRDHPVFAESAILMRNGQLPAEMIQAMALRPEILRAFAELSSAVYPGGVLDRRIQELVILKASTINNCQFCTSSHVDIMKQLGIDGDPSSLLDDPARLTTRERLAMEYVEQVLADSNRIDDGVIDRLREQFDDSEIVELTILVGYINMLNMFNNALGIRYRDEYAGAADR